MKKSKAAVVREGLEGIEEVFKKAIDEAYQRGKEVGVSEYIDLLKQGAITLVKEGVIKLVKEDVEIKEKSVVQFN